MDGINTFTDDQVKDLQTIIQQMLAPNAGDKKISALDAIPIIAAADLFAVVDATDTTTKKGTALQIKNYLANPWDRDASGIPYIYPLTAADKLHLNDAESTHFTTAHIQMFRNDTPIINMWSATATAFADPDINLIRSRGTIGTPLAVADNDFIGSMVYIGFSDGSTFNIGAQITAEINGAVSTGVLPCDLVFLVNPGGAVALEGMRLDKNKKLTVLGEGEFNSNLAVTSGTFQLPTGTSVNEIVTGITAANTDDQLATAKSIYDAILELSHTQYEYFTATAGQTAFTIVGPTPLNAHAAQIVVQGIVYQYGAGNDFTISGNALTWINTNYTLQLNDVVQLWYDGPGSEAREWSSYSGTLPAAGGTLVVTAAQLGLTDARQITDATLWGRGTDQNWYKAMNTWGGATHEFNFTIPTLADPNLGDLVIQVAGGASSVASQPFKISFEYTSTNFLT